MANKKEQYQPGQVISFTYNHPPWSRDANTRGPYKEILVIHTDWHGKVHGIDLKALTPAQKEILRIVMDPANNRVERGGIEGDPMQGQVSTGAPSKMSIGSSAVSTAPKRAKSDVIYQAMEIERQRIEKIRQLSAMTGKKMHPRVEGDHLDRMKKLNVEMSQAVEAESRPEPKKVERDARRRPMPLAAVDILKNIKPGNLVGNPHMLYHRFLKRFLNGADAYRIFWPMRMSAIQVDKRWNWTTGQYLGGSQMPMPQKKGQGQQAAAKPKFKGQQPETQADINRKLYELKFGSADPMQASQQPPRKIGQSPGVMEGTKQERKRKDAAKPTVNVIKAIKPPRPK